MSKIYLLVSITFFNNEALRSFVKDSPFASELREEGLSEYLLLGCSLDIRVEISKSEEFYLHLKYNGRNIKLATLDCRALADMIVTFLHYEEKDVEDWIANGDALLAKSEDMENGRKLRYWLITSKLPYSRTK